jgi:hypothetical protein
LFRVPALEYDPSMAWTRGAVALASATLAVVGCTAILGDFTVGASGGGSPDGGEGGPGGGDGGGVGSGDGGDAGIQCSMATKLQRTIPGDGGAVVAENMWIYSTQGSGAIGGVKGNNSGGAVAPSFVFQVRTDRLEDANVIALDGRAFSMTRAFDDTGTYALWGRNVVVGGTGQFELDLYHFTDATGINATPAASGTFAGPQPGAGDFASTQAGVFYAYALGNAPGGSYVVQPPNPPSPTYQQQVSNVGDTGLGDGGRLYILHDGSVSLFVTRQTTSGAYEVHQLHFVGGSGMPTEDRVFLPGVPAHVFGLTPNGASSVDIGVAIANDDAGTSFSIYVGTIPESKLFTFGLADLKALPPVGITIGATKPCLITHDGLAAVLSPNATSGFDFLLIDTATASVRYSLTGSNNLVHADTGILACAISSPRTRPGTTQYDVIWLDRAGGGGSSSTLQYAPLQCSAP